MDLRHLVTLPPDLIAMCEAWGERVVADYATGRNANSRAVSCFDAHSNADLQSKAKMAECAFALWAGVNPRVALHWERHCDDGSDLFKWGKRWDVKTTGMNSRYLLWPIAKNHIYESKKFDCLALVKHAVPQFEIKGWVSKTEFAEKKKVAPAGHLLVLGTWHMHENDLWGPDLLVDFAA